MGSKAVIASNPMSNVGTGGKRSFPNFPSPAQAADGASKFSSLFEIAVGRLASRDAEYGRVRAVDHPDMHDPEVQITACGRHVEITLWQGFTCKQKVHSVGHGKPPHERLRSDPLLPGRK